MGVGPFKSAFLAAIATVGWIVLLVEEDSSCHLTAGNFLDFYRSIEGPCNSVTLFQAFHQQHLICIPVSGWKWGIQVSSMVLNCWRNLLGSTLNMATCLPGAGTAGVFKLTFDIAWLPVFRYILTPVPNTDR